MNNRTPETHRPGRLISRTVAVAMGVLLLPSCNHDNQLTVNRTTTSTEAPTTTDNRPNKEAQDSLTSLFRDIANQYTEIAQTSAADNGPLILEEADPSTMRFNTTKNGRQFKLKMRYDIDTDSYEKGEILKTPLDPEQLREVQVIETDLDGHSNSSVDLRFEILGPLDGEHIVEINDYAIFPSRIYNPTKPLGANNYAAITPESLQDLRNTVSASRDKLVA